MSVVLPDLEMVTWLRGAVTARLVLARKATPGPWAREATGDKGNSWAAGFVMGEDENPLSGEVEHGRGVVIDGVCESIDGHLSDGAHIAANDPQDTIARCEAELDILNAHYILHREDRSEEYAEYSVTPHPGAHGCDFGCVSCHYRGLGGVWGQGVCYTVRRMALGYRHWPGWKEKWGAWHSTSPSTTTG